MKNNIDFLRKKAGFTVQQLADALGMTRGNLNKLKGGTVSLNTIQMKKIADILGCRPVDIIADLEETESSDNEAPKELIEAEKAGIDTQLLQECINLIRTEEKAQNKRFSEDTVIELAVTLYEGAAEDRKAGIETISVALARRIVKES